MACDLLFGQTITLLRMHVFSAAAEARIKLGEEGGYPRLEDNRRMKRADLAEALRAVFENRTMLMQRWSEIHG